MSRHVTTLYNVFMCTIFHVLLGADVRTLCAYLLCSLDCTIAVNFYIYFEQINDDEIQLSGASKHLISPN